MTELEQWLKEQVVLRKTSKVRSITTKKIVGSTFSLDAARNHDKLAAIAMRLLEAHKKTLEWCPYEDHATCSIARCYEPITAIADCEKILRGEK